MSTWISMSIQITQLMFRIFIQLSSRNNKIGLKDHILITMSTYISMSVQITWVILPHAFTNFLTTKYQVNLEHHIVLITMFTQTFMSFQITMLTQTSMSVQITMSRYKNMSVQISWVILPFIFTIFLRTKHLQNTKSNQNIIWS